MRVSLFKKMMAYLLDAMPIFLLLMVLNTLFVAEILKNPYTDYDANYEVYQQNVDEYYLTIDEYFQDLENEVITQDEYDTQVATLRDDFLEINGDTETVIYEYFTRLLYYFLISFLVIKYLYNVFTKGQTFGLKLMKLEMVGKINWFSLLLRELFWREVFWVFTFGLGLFVDLIMVTLTKKKRTLRDIFSNTSIIYQGTSYPF
jgi:hypothetical protein